MKYSKLLFILLTVFAGIFRANAQIFPGYNTSNYAGITSVDLNPANIVDSRYMFDMNLFGLNFINQNNYIGVNTKQILNGQIRTGSFPDYTSFQNANLYERPLGKRSFSLINELQIQGPSVLVSISHGFAIGISSEMRSILNIDGVDANLAKLSYYGLDYPSLFHQTFMSKNFSLREMTWSDIGIDVGKVIIDKGTNFLKVGVKVKLIDAQNSVYLRANNLNWEWNNDHILNLNNPSTDFQYGHSEGFDPGGTQNSAQDFLKFTGKPTVGFDVGAVYEYRPDAGKYEYTMDGKSGLIRNDLNKYKWKIGASITDIGWVKFNRPGTVTDFNANLVNFNIDNFSPSGIAAFDDSLKTESKNFTQKTSKNFYRVQLPTAFSVQFDYHLHKNFYANATYFGDMTIANTDPAHVHQISYVVLTPRWDTKYAGVFIPLSYDAYNLFKAGVSVHLGPVIFGMGNVFNLFLGKHIYGTDVHLALKIPIFYTRPHDRDHDGVSDRKDQCPRDSGTWATMGCPDKDGDGVPDKDDKCPALAGSKDHHGCPDSDGDGVYDDEDQCPTVKGSPDNHGCPAVVVAPDTTFKRPPPPVLKMPDTVKTVTPPPPPPVVKAPEPVKPEPPIEVKKPEPVVENVPDHFDDVHFDLGQAVLSTADDADLDNIAALLKRHPTWKVNLIGYADNTGTTAINIDVSHRRALAARQFLINKGVNKNQITTEWHGQDNPVGDNSTDAGRALNRRVEIKLVR